jgi:hypothetical protein
MLLLLDTKFNSLLVEYKLCLLVKLLPENSNIHELTLSLYTKIFLALSIEVIAKYLFIMGYENYYTLHS